MAIDLDMLALKLGGMLPTMTLDLDLDRYGQLTAASLAAFPTGCASSYTQSAVGYAAYTLAYVFASLSIASYAGTSATGESASGGTMVFT